MRILGWYIMQRLCSSSSVQKEHFKVWSSDLIRYAPPQLLIWWWKQIQFPECWILFGVLNDGQVEKPSNRDRQIRSLF